jgi:thiol-disulfide isomerase/thioredoxin
MKKVIPWMLFLFLFLSSMTGYSQELNTSILDSKSNKEILIGECNREGLISGEFGQLYHEYYPIYHPKKDVISRLKKHREGLSILIILGTWCSDSKEQVPKFLKVLDKIKFDGADLRMIAVDRDKQGGDADVSRYDVLRVPTFIFLRNGREIGRIIETPVRTLEEDMLAIVGE